MKKILILGSLLLIGCLPQPPGYSTTPLYLSEEEVEFCKDKGGRGHHKSWGSSTNWFYAKSQTECMNGEKITVNRKTYQWYGDDKFDMYLDRWTKKIKERF